MRILSQLFLGLFLILNFTTITWAQEISLSFTPNPNQPVLESPNINVDSAEYDTLILRIKSGQNSQVKILWANSYDPQFNEMKSIWFSVHSGEHIYTFDILSQNPNWIGWVNKIVLLPDGGPQNVEVKEAKLLCGNIVTKIASGWQEFWGPKGRVVIGSTINTIPSSAIFGQSVNIYIYFICLIVLVVSFSFAVFRYLGKKIKINLFVLSNFWQAACRNTIIFALIMWVILALNTDYNFFNIFISNFRQYYGKSLDEKRAAAYGKDYYEFLNFAKYNLPVEPVTFDIISSRFSPQLQSRIYLVPHTLNFDPNKKPDYILVFYPPPGQPENKPEYELFAKLNDNAFILKRSR